MTVDVRLELQRKLNSESSKQLPRLCSDVRTNNGVEGWHHRFSRRVRISHPNTWNLIEDIAKEHRHSRLLYSQIEAGQRIALGRVRYNRINSRIRDYEEERQAGQLQTLDFLTRVGHLLR